jgi:hypothetical protein
VLATPLSDSDTDHSEKFEQLAVRLAHMPPTFFAGSLPLSTKK